MARKNREHHDEDQPEEPVVMCWLCGRSMGATVEWHHPVPKSRGGRERQPIHAICHKTVHANFSNSELERRYSTVESLLGHPEIKRFVDWIANKPPEFNAPTKDRR